MNLYETLELEPSASLDEIKKSYRRLAKIHHPDRTQNPKNVIKFQEITSAYEILSNDESRKKYLMLNTDSKSMFQEFLQNIFSNTLDANNLKRFGINITTKDHSYLENNFYDVINSLDLAEIMNFFKSGEFPKKDFDLNNACSDTDITSWDTHDALYLSKLPVELQKHNSQTLRIILNITLEQLINNKEKTMTVKRKIDNEFIDTEFSFNYKNQFIVFSGGGDTNSELVGDLIIKINLPESYDWQDNLIIYQQYITLYEYVYGTNINFKIGNKDIEYINWIPAREGNIILLNEIDNCSYSFAIKLLLKYQDDEIKKSVLKEYFD
jgi:DnaJ-class molecular chaperone